MRLGHAGLAKALGTPAALLLALAVFLASCVTPPGSKADSGGKGDGSVTMAGVFCVCFANAYVAWKKGFFEEEGVKVKDLVTTKAGADTFQAVASGDAQLALSGLDAIMRGREQGIEVRPVATVSPEFYALSVRKQLAGEIQDVSSLKDRKVSVSKIGSTSWGFLRQLLARAGMSDKDVQIVQLGGIDTTMAGLKKGTVDAAITWEPGTSQGRQQGFSEVVLDALNPADHQKIYGSKTSISMTLATTEAFIKSNPKVAKGAVRALDKADAWIADHSAEEVASVIEPLAKGLDHATLVAAVENTMKSMPTSAAVSKAAYTESANRLKEAGILKKVPPLEESFDCDVAECTE